MGLLMLTLVALLLESCLSLGFAPLSFLSRSPAVVVGEKVDDAPRSSALPTSPQGWTRLSSARTRRLTQYHAQSKGFGVGDVDDDRNGNLASEKTKNTDGKLSAEGSPSVHGEAFVDQMDDARRNALYLTLLRDLQIEGVPILEVDVMNDDVSVMFAALWTILSQLVEEADAAPSAQADGTSQEEDSDAKVPKDNSVRACVVINGASIDTLKRVANYMASVTSDASLADSLPELRRIKSVSVLGRGVGPALELSVLPYNEDGAPFLKNAPAVDQDQATHSSLTFVNRMLGSLEIYPAGTPTDVLSLGYRLFPGTDLLSALAAIWTCVCEVMVLDASPMGSANLFLTLPGVAPGTSTQAHDRFLATVEIVDRAIRETIMSNERNTPFRVAYFHPAYDRRLILEQGREAEFVGHLPSLGKLRPLISTAEDCQILDSRSEEELAQLQNYQRRSPNFAIQFNRPQQETDFSDIMNTYVRNLVNLAKEGEEKLRSTLENEMQE